MIGNAPPGVVIAAPASNGGKTTVTLALLRALRRRGVGVASCKVGPDYIDPAFHAAASGRACLNLDPWAMRQGTLARLAAKAGDKADLLVVEGVMGLFDGAADGTGSTADLAAAMDWPVVLVVDVKGQASSAGAVIKGFAEYRSDVRVTAVIFNRVGGPGHRMELARVAERLGMPVLGFLPRRDHLHLPDRHLGLVQAVEHADLEVFLDRAAEWAEESLDLERFSALARPARPVAEEPAPSLPPLGQRIALARDPAFAFAYPHLLEDWRRAGAELLPFSPLADQAPDREADAVFLPGGYPELHAGRLAAASTFLGGVDAAARRGAVVYGECGGYMVLGRGLIDSQGVRHAMAGLLPLETSFARRRLHLGYREATLLTDTPFGVAGRRVRGHEFHYATVLEEASEQSWIHYRTALGDDLGVTGSRVGGVMGSFLHLVDGWN